MKSVVFFKTYKAPPFCQREILRYAGCNQANSEILELMEECIKELNEKLTYKVCYREFSVETENNICDFKSFKLQSENLAFNLKGCKRAIIFAATIGVEIDRLITRYSHISPSKALFFQAIGAERIEALCDMFCEDIEKELNCKLKPRFSPGYGDLSLDAQKDIFLFLESEKRIGISLNNSLLISPSKSVTAIIGIEERE